VVGLSSKNFSRLFALVLIACVASGCATSRAPGAPKHQVKNVFRKDTVLPVNVRRVAVLPMSYRQPTASLVAGKRSLEPVFRTELAKASRFETIYIEPSQLKQWTGKEQWDSYEDLPPKPFIELWEKTGAEAVLFVHLSEYKAYPPMAIGWRMKLVRYDLDILWAVEEMFDAAEEGVSNAAQQYERDQERSNPVLEDSRSILLSPTRFGHYTLKAVLETLPAR
jgi:hypothetical protein